MSKTILVSLEDRYDSDDGYVIPFVFKDTGYNSQCLFEIVDRGDLNEAYLLISYMFPHTANTMGIRQNILNYNDSSTSIACVKFNEDEGLVSEDSIERENDLFPYEHDGDEHDEDEYDEEEDGEYEQDDYEETSDENR